MSGLLKQLAPSNDEVLKYMKTKTTHIAFFYYLIISLGLNILLFDAVYGYSDFGAPTEFGNETNTTCFIGGDLGLLNCTGNIITTGKMGAGTITPNATLTVVVGGTTIADEWTVRSDRSLKQNIVDYFPNISDLKIYKYRFKVQNKTTREHIGLMTDEVPDELLGADGQGIDLYAYISYVFSYAQKLQEKNIALMEELCSVNSNSYSWCDKLYKCESKLIYNQECLGDLSKPNSENKQTRCYNAFKLGWTNCPEGWVNQDSI